MCRDSSPGRVLAAGPELEQRRNAEGSRHCWSCSGDPVGAGVLKRPLDCPRVELVEPCSRAAALGPK
ncbi:hypothetical protein NDU88_002013 [Pleurodeles waltl]|uniref:Uncharacterized protein n=1 Tax=Pleurodeles waltl TaxID=8319 RepID=A0AAV7V9E2_PLEWA|nr:hypothetical protein NDU88_002013 [Pleurodeles waltl]